MNSATSFFSQLNHWRDRLISGGTLPLLLVVSLLSLGCLLTEWAIGYFFFSLRGVTVSNPSMEALELVVHPETYLHEPSATFRVLASLFKISHYLLLAFFTATLTAGLLHHRKELQRGRGDVAVKGKYYLIVGWSDQVFTVVKELLLAHGNSTSFTLAILADKPKEWMQSRIEERNHIPKNARLIVRNGTPQELFDLQRVRPELAASAIVLPTGNDVETIKTIMALSSPETQMANAALKVVAELNDPSQIHLARIIAPQNAISVYTKDVMVRLLAQTSLHAGLHFVYEELFGFDGAEIYFKPFPELVGKTFGEIWSGFEHACLIGVRQNIMDWQKGVDEEVDPFKRKHERSIVLFPPNHYLFKEDDKLIFIGEDFQDIRYTGSEFFEGTKLPIAQKPAARKGSQMLVLGWNTRTSFRLLKELNAYAEKGTQITVVDEKQFTENEADEMSRVLSKSSIEFKTFNPFSRKNLGQLRFQEYQQVILAHRSDVFSAEEADMKALSQLVQVRDLIAYKGANCNLVSQIEQPNMKELGKVLAFNDFILSRELISRLMVQLAINPELQGVYEELFDAYGCEIQLHPIDHYLPVDQPLRFLDLCTATYRQKAIALGYALLNEENRKEKPHGIYLNPHKKKAVQFSEKDRVIVLVER